MTQAEKTEAVIADAYSASDLSVVTGKVEAHARELARKLDAVLTEVGDEPGTFCYNCQSDVEFDAEYYCPNCRSYAFYHDGDRRIRAIVESRP